MSVIRTKLKNRRMVKNNLLEQGNGLLLRWVLEHSQLYPSDSTVQIQLHSNPWTAPVIGTVIGPAPTATVMHPC